MATTLNGTNAYLSMSEQSSQFASEATLSVWLKMTSANPPAGKSGLLALGSDQTAEATQYPWPSDGLGYFAIFRDSGSRIDAVDLGSTNRAQWHHFVIVTSPGTNGWKLLVNSTLIHQATGHSSISFRSGDWWIGRCGDSGQFYFDGAMAEFALWNAALGSSEIGWLANGRSPISLTHRLGSLVAYQDLIRPLNHPGIGPAASANGGTGVTDHAPVAGHFASHRFAPPGFARLLPIWSAAREARQTGAVLGQSSLAGAASGASFPVGEVAS